jgi:glutamine amidotransferase
MKPNRKVTPEVRIVDYGLGNLRSVTRGLEKAGATVEITDDAAEIESAEALVLPGVGAFEQGMEGASDVRDALHEAAEDTPLLGVCLGMQMLMTESEEGTEDEAVEGLDLVEGRVVRFPSGVGKVPHMGWNTLGVERDHPVVEGTDGEHFYFVHSYYVPEQGSGETRGADAPRVEESDATVAATEYGHNAEQNVGFSSVVSNEKGNVVGTQFHPEKSGEAGLRLLGNFVEFASGY